MFSNAESYERFMGRWSRLMADRLVAFANVPEEGRLLDIGSGTGALALTLLQLRPKAKVLGIDASKEYVAYAASLNSSPDRLTFEVGDAQQMRFADATFQGALSLLAFNFIPNPLKAVQEARRVTQPGGPVATAVWDYGENMRMLRIFWDAAAALDEGARRLDEAHMPLCRAGELKQLWQKAGLTNVREQPLDIEMSFDAFDDYWGPFLFGQGPAGAYATSLDSAALQRLQTELKRRLFSSAEESSFVLPARAWAVCGTAPLD